ncbi:haloacid dehalogenase type II [Notoacmeibacter ruber]|uniref:(S)-2-haloacid dehalogenase n=1 Tax=Notoacmeibacter ruber TaxID=2670375 RepID=A0A3L7JH51_9HYPH|nr:haloacid dehalogenase type II [Notoacmeibacter ruber]RLQ88951.1 haloacid dehalogenase type II [Notoacmeibacter ruber]
MAEKIKVAVFDIIETVFSLKPVRRAMAACGLDGRDLETWFAFGLRDAFALDVTHRARPFPEILADALDELLAIRQIQVRPEAREDVLNAFAKMPAHDDARACFDRLRDGGITIVALSNGPAERTRSLLDGAGLCSHVQEILSVESVGRFKPHISVYEQAFAVTGLPPEAHCMIACHAWDLHGAKCAGMKTAFVGRGQHYPSVMEPADLTGEELIDVAGEILKAD